MCVFPVHTCIWAREVFGTAPYWMWNATKRFFARDVGTSHRLHGYLNACCGTTAVSHANSPESFR